MIIGDRLRALREEKKLSQGDIEKRTGLLRCYVPEWRMVTPFPPWERLRRWLGALEIPMYQLFYDGDEPPKLLNRRTTCAWKAAVLQDRFLRARSARRLKTMRAVSVVKLLVPTNLCFRYLS